MPASSVTVGEAIVASVAVALGDAEGVPIASVHAFSSSSPVDGVASWANA
jgi:hypothetical protein